MRGPRTAGLLAGTLLAVLLPAATPALAADEPAAAVDRTSAVEAARSDRVPTPRIGWYPCYNGAECGTAQLPLDYDDPQGPTTEVAVLRLPARDRARRIGSLFVNPGGPGGSGTQVAALAPQFLSPGLLDRFDVVGFDPRGIAFSDNVRCFADNGAQQRALAPLLTTFFPYGPVQERAWVRSARQLGQACATTGRPLAAHMSTANVARDMDVLRRAVGDRQLTYLGFSYGSYLGQVYANLFPDRVRALAIDGVLDPLAWAGRPATAGIPVTERLRSGEGASAALREILERCDRAGGQRCVAAVGDPVANYELVASRLKAKPLEIVDPVAGPVRVTYADLVGATLGLLYAPTGSAQIAQLLADLLVLTEPPAALVPVAPDVVQRTAAALTAQRAPARAFDFPYFNDVEAFAAVLCADSLNPRDAAAWPDAADRAATNARYFCRLWTWQSVFCASGTWTARDDDAYRGEFTARTANPVLVVGNLWDPATNYQGAVTAARLLPRSRLLTSDSWGHTAYGTSACVTGAMDAYLLTQALPWAGATCTGDAQPFAGTPAPPTPPTPAAAAEVPEQRSLPPVVPPLPRR